MVAVGIAVAIYANIKEFDLVGMAKTLIIVGAVVAVYAKLKVRTEENSETYRLGYDIGFEAGHQEGRKTTRPVVVDINARRCMCGGVKEQNAAVKVIDRV